MRFEAVAAIGSALARLTRNHASTCERESYTSRPARSVPVGPTQAVGSAGSTMSLPSRAMARPTSRCHAARSAAGSLFGPSRASQTP
jgi:hypothetical protein